MERRNPGLVEEGGGGGARVCPSCDPGRRPRGSGRSMHTRGRPTANGRTLGRSSQGKASQRCLDGWNDATGEAGQCSEAHATGPNEGSVRAPTFCDRTGRNGSCGDHGAGGSGNFRNGNCSSFGSDSYQSGETPLRRSDRDRPLQRGDVPTTNPRKGVAPGSDQGNADDILAMAHRLHGSGMLEDPSINEGASDPEYWKDLRGRKPRHTRPMRGSGRATNVPPRQDRSDKRGDAWTASQQRRMHHPQRKPSRSLERNQEWQTQSSSHVMAIEADGCAPQQLCLLAGPKQRKPSHRHGRPGNNSEADNNRALVPLDSDFRNSTRSHDSHRSGQSRLTTNSRSTKGLSHKSGGSRRSGKSARSAFSCRSFRSNKSAGSKRIPKKSAGSNLRISKKSAGSKRIPWPFKSLAKGRPKPQSATAAGFDESNASSAISLSAEAISLAGLQPPKSCVPSAVVAGASRSGSFDDVSSYCSSKSSYDDKGSSGSGSWSTSSSSVVRVSVAEAVKCLNTQKKRRGFWPRR